MELSVLFGPVEFLRSATRRESALLMVPSETLAPIPSIVAREALLLSMDWSNTLALNWTCRASPTEKKIGAGARDWKPSRPARSPGPGIGSPPPRADQDKKSKKKIQNPNGALRLPKEKPWLNRCPTRSMSRQIPLCNSQSRETPPPMPREMAPRGVL